MCECPLPPVPFSKTRQSQGPWRLRGGHVRRRAPPAPARFHPVRQAHLHPHPGRGTPTAPRLSWSTVPSCPKNTAGTKDFPDEDTARETEINVNTAKRAGF